MTKRIYKFDNLKFLLIFLVVLGHFIDYYTNNSDLLKKIFIFIYSFHMPVFIFLSGLFSKKIKTFQDVNYNKIFYYIFISMLMKIVIFFVSDANQQQGFQLLGGGDIYWFLIVISIYLFFLPIIDRFNEKWLLMFSLLISLVVGYDASINDFLYLSRMIVFFPFFLIGHILSDKKNLVVKYAECKYIKVISCLIISVFLFVVIFKLNYIYSYRTLFTGKNPYSWVSIVNCSYKNRLICYAIQFIIGFSIMSIVPNKKIGVFTNLGERTFQVYALHVPIILLVNQLECVKNLIFVNKYLFYTLCFIISLLLTLILSAKSIGKIFDKLRKCIFS